MQEAEVVCQGQRYGKTSCLVEGSIGKTLPVPILKRNGGSVESGLSPENSQP